MEEDTRYGTNIQNNERKDRGNPEKLFEFVQDRGATSTRLLADPLNKGMEYREQRLEKMFFP